MIQGPGPTPYAIAGPGRQCAASGRELLPGERFFSALLDEGGKLLRKDFAADAWPGAPAGAIAFWGGRIPTAEQPRRPVINDDLLLDCFDHLKDAAEPRQRNFRYIVALLLMRRKRLKFEDVKKADGIELLCLRDAKSGQRHEVADPRLSEEEMTAVQEEVFRVLGWN